MVFYLYRAGGIKRLTSHFETQLLAPLAEAACQEPTGVANGIATDWRRRDEAEARAYRTAICRMPASRWF